MTEGDRRHTIDIDALAAELLSEHLVSAIDSIELTEGAARTPFDLPGSSELPGRLDSLIISLAPFPHLAPSCSNRHRSAAWASGPAAVGL